MRVQSLILLALLIVMPLSASGEDGGELVNIDGRVWCDANSSGEVESSEDLSLAGVGVIGLDGSGNPVGTGTTDSDGGFWVHFPSSVQTVILDPLTLPSDATVSPESYPVPGADQIFLVDSDICRPADLGGCWMTGGGVKFSPITGTNMAERGPQHSIGGNVFPSCSPEPGDGGQWNHVNHAEKLHFQGWSVQTVSCGNVPGIPSGSESPVTPFNFIEFVGNGTLKGIKGNKLASLPVQFFARVEDHNEPGSNGAKAGADIDRYFIHVFDASGNTQMLLDIDGDSQTVDPVTITGGNLQLHFSGCE